MLYVVRVIKKSLDNAKVQVSDGRIVMVPPSLAVWGMGILEGDISELYTTNGTTIFWHVLLFEKHGKKATVLFRDLSTFDVRHELALIRECVLKCHRRVLGHFWASDQLEDLVLEIFLVLMERDCFCRWDASLSNYQSYVQSAVKNYLIDIVRKAKHRPEIQASSLNERLRDGTGEERIDRLRDNMNTDIIEELSRDALYERLKSRVMELDQRENKEVFGDKEKKGLPGTGIAGFTYMAIFNVLVSGEDLDGFLSSFQHGTYYLRRYVIELQKELRDVADSYMGGM